MSDTTPEKQGSLNMVIKTKCPVCGTILVMKNGRFFHYKEKRKKNIEGLAGRPDRIRARL